MALDLNLPGRDGITCVAQLRQAGHSVPAVVISNSDPGDHQAAAVAAGAEDVLEKPSDFTGCLALAERLLRD